MSDKIEKLSPRNRKIVKHISALAVAGQDIEKFSGALRGVRDDPQLTGAMREAIWKTLAQEAAQAYYVFTTGRPLDFAELFGEMPDVPAEAEEPG